MRIAIIGLGAIGREVVTAALARGDQLVAASDMDPQLVGKDAGDVLGCPALGVQVMPELTIGSADVDVVLHAAGSSFETLAAQVTDLLSSGFRIVSTCEELAYPWRTNDRLAREVDRCARKGNGAIIGTGINPGFAMDTLPLVASAACLDVRRVRVRRTLDASRRRQSFQQKIGVGRELDEFTQELDERGLGHVGLAQSAWMISDGLALGGEQLDEDLEIVKDVTGGRVAGLRQRAVITKTSGEIVVDLEVGMIGDVAGPRDWIEIQATPLVELEVNGGIPGDGGTVAVILNVARQLPQMRPGLLTMLDFAFPRSLMGRS